MKRSVAILICILSVAVATLAILANAAPETTINGNQRILGYTAYSNDGTNDAICKVYNSKTLSGESDFTVDPDGTGSGIAYHIIKDADGVCSDGYTLRMTGTSGFECKAISGVTPQGCVPVVTAEGEWDGTQHICRADFNLDGTLDGWDFFTDNIQILGTLQADTNEDGTLDWEASTITSGVVPRGDSTDSGGLETTTLRSDAYSFYPLGSGIALGATGPDSWDEFYSNGTWYSDAGAGFSLNSPDEDGTYHERAATAFAGTGDTLDWTFRANIFYIKDGEFCIEYNEGSSQYACADSESDGTSRRLYGDKNANGAKDSGEYYYDLPGDMEMQTYDSGADGTVDSCDTCANWSGNPGYLPMAGGDLDAGSKIGFKQPNSSDFTTFPYSAGLQSADTSCSDTNTLALCIKDKTPCSNNQMQCAVLDANGDGTNGEFRFEHMNVKMPDGTMYVGDGTFTDVTAGDTIKMEDAGSFVVSTYNSYYTYPLRNTFSVVPDPGSGNGHADGPAVHVPFKVVWHDMANDGTNGGSANTVSVKWPTGLSSSINVTLPLAGGQLVTSASTVSWGGKLSFPVNGGAATINLPSGGTVGSPADGDLWQDGTTKALTGYIDGVKQSLEGVIYTLTSDDTDATTAETDIINAGGVGTLTMPANFLTVGKTVRVRAWGYYSTAAGAPPNITMKLYYGSTAVSDSGATTMAASVTNQMWFVNVLCTTRTTGSSGTVMCQGDGQFHSTHTDEKLMDMEATAAVTINTTTTNAIALKATWSASGQSITCTNATVEVLN